ncbi:MAG: cation diffusion facilitator family transporter [Terriglobia bacterium]
MSRALRWALGVNLAFVVVEFAGGYLGQSLALISDAVHNLTDVPSMSLSLFALYAQRRPADSQRTYGYQRSGVLAAFVNALVLIAVALYIFYHAYLRLLTPVSVHTGWMLWVSAAGIGVNGGIAWGMWRGRRDLNLRTVLIHNAGDAASNLAILVGALVIAATGWYVMDSLLGFAIGVAVLWSAWSVLRETTHILLEGTPRELRVEDVARAMLKVPGVAEVHDVHIWSLAAHLHALSCHVRIEEMPTRESEKILAQLNALLARDFGINHTTIQFEPRTTPVPAHFVPSQTKEKDS